MKMTSIKTFYYWDLASTNFGKPTFVNTGLRMIFPNFSDILRLKSHCCTIK